MKNADYKIEKRTLEVVANNCAVTISFESDPLETSIWHYVFDALSRRKEASIKPTGIPLE